MGEDLKRCNIIFRRLLEKVKERQMVSESEESLFYFFFLGGYNTGSGMEQIIT